mmetsp:Transcript_22912/g.50330  ORF Transcript_22912/g.50330 Transcript_22912/m.50330 type:complete len:297 (-) Transcript_22912:1681-2571(-)
MEVACLTVDVPGTGNLKAMEAPAWNHPSPIAAAPAKAARCFPMQAGVPRMLRYASHVVVNLRLSTVAAGRRRLSRPTASQHSGMPLPPVPEGSWAASDSTASPRDQPSTLVECSEASTCSEYSHCAREPADVSLGHTGQSDLSVRFSTRGAQTRQGSTCGAQVEACSVARWAERSQTSSSLGTELDLPAAGNTTAPGVEICSAAGHSAAIAPPRRPSVDMESREDCEFFASVSFQPALEAAQMQGDTPVASARVQRILEAVPSGVQVFDMASEVESHYEPSLADSEWMAVGVGAGD